MKVALFDILLVIVFIAMFCSAIATPCVLTAAVCSNGLAVLFLISLSAIKGKWVATHFGALVPFLLRDLFGYNNRLYYLRFFDEKVRSWLSRLEDAQLVNFDPSTFSFQPMSNEVLNFRVEAFLLLFSYTVDVFRERTGMSQKENKRSQVVRSLKRTNTHLQPSLMTPSVGAIRTMCLSDD